MAYPIQITRLVPSKRQEPRQEVIGERRFLCYSPEMIRIIALLGNAGSRYERTRHNVAWMFGSYCRWDSQINRAKWGAEYAEISMAGSRVTIIKPQRFMNRSGESVAQFARYLRVDATELLVVHDDVELAFGEVSWKSGGGLSGHNGLRSLADRIGSPDFRRLRIGIGRPEHGSVASFVLSAFSRYELERLETVFAEACLELEKRISE
jgi:peptidyl-tRNA hydrolase, PTH1 family